MTIGTSVGLIALLTAVMMPGCGRSDVEVEFYLARGYSFTLAERSLIQAVADAAARDVRRLLPTLPRGLVLRVAAGAGAQVIPETGETGAAYPPATVSWTVDPGRPGGVARTVRNHLRAALFHEFYHLVRYQRVARGGALMNEVVGEGLAIAFERDEGGAAPAWGRYPAEVDQWVRELTAQPPDAPRDRWLVAHPDGRRWIGLRAGTYLVDRVRQATGRSAVSLVHVPTHALLDLLPRSAEEQELSGAARVQSQEVR